MVGAFYQPRTVVIDLNTLATLPQREWRAGYAEIVKYGEHFQTFSSVPPGITGLWQVCGRNDTTYEERIQLDMYYVHHWSPWLDLYLLARTIKTVLFTRGAY